MRPGLIIRLLRTANGISQGTLAERLNVSRVYLSQVENLHRIPGLPLLRHVGREFDIPVSLLVVADDEGESVVHLQMQLLLKNVLAAKIQIGLTRRTESLPDEDS